MYWTMIVYPHFCCFFQMSAFLVSLWDEHRDAKLEAMTALLEVESTKADVCETAT